MIASDNDTVAALDERAQAHRVAGGVRARHTGCNGADMGVADLVARREETGPA